MSAGTVSGVTIRFGDFEQKVDVAKAQGLSVLAYALSLGLALQSVITFMNTDWSRQQESESYTLQLLQLNESLAYLKVSKVFTIQEENLSVRAELKKMLLESIKIDEN